MAAATVQSSTNLFRQLAWNASVPIEVRLADGEAPGAAVDKYYVSKVWALSELASWLFAGHTVVHLQLSGASLELTTGPSSAIHVPPSAPPPDQGEPRLTRAGRRAAREDERGAVVV